MQLFKSQNCQFLSHFNLTAFQKLLLITLPHQLNVVAPLCTLWLPDHRVGLLVICWNCCRNASSYVIQATCDRQKGRSRKGRRATKSGKKWQPEQPAKNRKKLGICWKGFLVWNSVMHLDRAELAWAGDWATGRQGPQRNVAKSAAEQQ